MVAVAVCSGPPGSTSLVFTTVAVAVTVGVAGVATSTRTSNVGAGDQEPPVTGMPLGRVQVTCWPAALQVKRLAFVSPEVVNPR